MSGKFLGFVTLKLDNEVETTLAGMDDNLLTGSTFGEREKELKQPFPVHDVVLCTKWMNEWILSGISDTCGPRAGLDPSHDHPLLVAASVVLIIKDMVVGKARVEERESYGAMLPLLLTHSSTHSAMSFIHDFWNEKVEK